MLANAAKLTVDVVGSFIGITVGANVFMELMMSLQKAWLFFIVVWLVRLSVIFSGSAFSRSDFGCFALRLPLAKGSVCCFAFSESGFMANAACGVQQA
jgi:hypothetical protein